MSYNNVCVEKYVKGLGGGQMVDECRLAAMQSKYLDQRQEVIMRKFCCSLPVLTSVTLRAGSVTGHTVFYFPLKDRSVTLGRGADEKM